MKKYINKSITIYAAGALLSLLALSPISFLGVAILIILSAGILPVKINYFYRFLLSLLLFFSINTLIGGIFFLLKVPLDIHKLLLIYSLAFIVTAPANFSLKPLKEILEFQSLVKFVIAVLMIVAIGYPALNSGQSGLIKTVTFGGDNISHFELTKVVEKSNGYFYKDAEISKYVITEGLSGYPQGLHLNVYLMKQAIDPAINLSGYGRFAAFNYAFFILMFVALAFMYYLLYRGIESKFPIEKTLLGVIFTGVIFSGLFFSLFALGSQAQIASLALFLGMLFFLQRTLESNDTKNKQLFACLSILMFGGIPFTWLLLLPPAGLILAIVILKTFVRPVFSNPLNHIRLLAISLIVVLCAAIQLVVQIMYSSPKNEGVNEMGFSMTPSIYFISAGLILALIFILTSPRLTKSLWLPALIVPSLFAYSIYLYQYMNVGEARYYFYKAAYVAVLVALVAIAIGASNIFNESFKKNSKYIRISVYVALLGIAASLIAFNVTNPKDYFVQRKGGAFSSELSVTALRLIQEDPDNGKRIIAVGSCNRANDHTLTRFAGAITGHNDASRQALLKNQLLPYKEDLYQAIKNYQANNTPNIIILSSDFKLQNYLQNRLKNDFGEEQFIDLDFGHVPKQVEVCPEMPR